MPFFSLQFRIPFTLTPWVYSPEIINPGVRRSEVFTKGITFPDDIDERYSTPPPKVINRVIP